MTLTEKQQQEILEVCQHLINSGIAYHALQLRVPGYPATSGLAEIVRIVDGPEKTKTVDEQLDEAITAIYVKYGPRLDLFFADQQAAHDAGKGGTNAK
jgi:hypothetical protein